MLCVHSLWSCSVCVELVLAMSRVWPLGPGLVWQCGQCGSGYQWLWHWWQWWHSRPGLAWAWWPLRHSCQSPSLMTTSAHQSYCHNSRLQESHFYIFSLHSLGKQSGKQKPLWREVIIFSQDIIFDNAVTCQWVSFVMMKQENFCSINSIFQK